MTNICGPHDFHERHALTRIDVQGWTYTGVCVCGHRGPPVHWWPTATTTSSKIICRRRFERRPPVSDLTPEQRERYWRTRQLTRPEGIRKTLGDLERAAADTDLPEPVQDLCGDAATTIRSLQDQLERERSLGSIEDFARGEQQPDPVSGRRISREPHDGDQGTEAQAEYDESPELQELLRRAMKSTSATKINRAARRAARGEDVAFEEHYKDHPEARPSLAEVALALAAQDGSPLADRPDPVERAAAEITARHPDADADDVLEGAEKLREQAEDERPDE